jgi:signal transduction histidine kinase
LLREGVPVAIPEPAALQVDRIRLGAQHLLQLIEEILTFSGLEAGSHNIVTTDVATRVILDELEAIIQPLADQQGLEFNIRIDGAPDTLHTDPTKLRQVLLNLLSNAVKFTDEGSVTLIAGARHGQPYFTVQDTGIGIADADQLLLFEPFWQVDQSRARTREGAGLGLAIAHRMAGLLGGEIDVSSQPGLGSEFILRLPSSAAIDNATRVEKP